jgi:hypothetical protein
MQAAIRHLERMPVTLSASFGSGSMDGEILRFAQDDRGALRMTEGQSG